MKTHLVKVNPIKKLGFILFISILFSFCSGKTSPKENLSNVEFSLQTGHIENITSLTFTPDNRTLITGSLDNVIRIWEVESAKEIKQIQPSLRNNGGITSVTCSNNGDFIASGDNRGYITIWNTRNYSQTNIFKAHKSGINVVAFSPDDKKILSGGRDHKLKMWDVANGKLLFNFQGHKGAVTNLQMSRDGNFITSSAQDSTIRVWDLQKGVEYRSWYIPSPELSMAFPSENRLVLSNNKTEGIVQIWAVANWKEIGRLKEEFISIGSTPDEKEIYVIAKNKIELRNFLTGALTRIVYEEDGIGPSITQIAFSIDTKFVALVINNQEIRIIDGTTGKIINSIGRSILGANEINVTPDGKYIFAENKLAFGSLLAAYPLDSTFSTNSLKSLTSNNSPFYFRNNYEVLVEQSYKEVALFDIRTGKVIREFRDNFTQPFIISPKGDYFVARFDKYLSIFDFNTGIRTKDIMKTDSYLKFLDFSKDGKYLLVASLTYFKIFEMPVGKEVKNFMGTEFNQICSFDIDANGDYIIIESYYNKITIKNALFGDVKKKIADVKFQEIRDVKLSKDKNILAIADLSGKVILYNLKEMKITKMLYHKAGVTSVVFSPNGKYVISASMDGEIKISDLNPGKELITIVGVIKNMGESKNPIADYVAYSPKKEFSGNETTLRGIVQFKRDNKLISPERYWNQLFIRNLLSKTMESKFSEE